MTGRFEFLFVKRSYEEDWENEYIQKVVEDMSPATEAAVSAIGADKTATRQSKGAAKAAHDKGETHRADTEVSKRTGKAPKKDNQEQSSSQVSEKKAQDAQFQKAKILRVRYDQALSREREIMESIDRDPEWAWARSDALQADIANSKHDLVEFKGSHMFWSTWALAPSLSAVAKKKFTPDTVSEQLSRIPALEAKLALLKEAIRVVLAMHGARKQ